MNADSEAFRQHLIGLACDPHSGMDTQKRSLLSLISLPSAAQKICTEAEREHVVRTVQKAMDAAVAAALQEHSTTPPRNAS